MTNTDDKAKVREAIAVFIDPDNLKQAVRALLASGVSREQLGLLATEHSVRESLEEFYTFTNNSHEPDKAPVTAFVDKNAANEQQDSLGGSLFFAGTTGAAGAVVASSAVFGGALLAALSGVVAVGLVGALASKIIHQSDADFLQQQIDEGHILLFVRLLDASRERDILETLKNHHASDVKVHEIDAKPGD
ncbi:hypothetical protein PHACT_15310 [Pseudohongiella acticola]|uniref:DUF1269 domain-containing protein n=1 Tax=Pseudohongiella acticola TaxID=1524254 RepID=A0A1E8CFS9_9GAMM|nr:hypothetical protein [Pseudohongiella acticola]OFE11206.1 hypothetical protein PHACT_15310 [Pseudohongiella acticola]